MLSLDLITDNKLASSAAVAVTLGVILLVSASAMPSVDDNGDENGKKKALNGVGGSVLALGIVAGVYDQYMRKFGGGAFSSSEMSEMSPSDLASFQERVAAAAANLRKSMEEASSGSSSFAGEESSAELAARASAQISSFIQNYS